MFVKIWIIVLTIAVGLLIHDISRLEHKCDMLVESLTLQAKAGLMLAHQMQQWDRDSRPMVLGRFSKGVK